jgi:hypothetical protein
VAKATSLVMGSTFTTLRGLNKPPSSAPYCKHGLNLAASKIAACPVQSKSTLHVVIHNSTH